MQSSFDDLYRDWDGKHKLIHDKEFILFQYTSRVQQYKDEQEKKIRDREAKVFERVMDSFERSKLENELCLELTLNGTDPISENEVLKVLAPFFTRFGWPVPSKMLVQVQPDMGCTIVVVYFHESKLN